MEIIHQKQGIGDIKVFKNINPMKKILLFPFLLLFHQVFAGTGGARDMDLLYLVVIAFMAMILAVLYSISFVKKMIKDLKQRRIVHLTDSPEGGDAVEDFL